MKYAITGKIRAGKASLTWLEQKNGSFKIQIAKSLLATLEMKTKQHTDKTYSHFYNVRIAVTGSSESFNFDYLKRSEEYAAKDAPDLLSWGSQIVIDTVMNMMKDAKPWN